jgi:hypothetical protein
LRRLDAEVSDVVEIFKEENTSLFNFLLFLYKTLDKTFYNVNEGLEAFLKLWTRKTHKEVLDP